MSKKKTQRRKSAHNIKQAHPLQSAKIVRKIFWKAASFLVAAAAGAAIGFFFLPGRLGVLTKEGGAYAGGIIGILITFLLLSIREIVADPKRAFAGILPGMLDGVDLSGCVQGCCSLVFGLLASIAGTVGGLLFGHTLLLGILTGGTTTLLTLTLFIGLAVLHQKEKPSSSMLGLVNK